MTNMSPLPEPPSNRVAEVFVKHLARGGIKLLPVVGALLEQMIFGTVDEVQANKDAEALRNGLATIRRGATAQSEVLSDILERATERAQLSGESEAQVNEIIDALRGVKAISPDVQESIKRFLAENEAAGSWVVLLANLLPILWKWQDRRILRRIERRTEVSGAGP